MSDAVLDEAEHGIPVPPKDDFLTYCWLVMMLDRYGDCWDVSTVHATEASARREAATRIRDNRHGYIALSDIKITRMQLVGGSS